MKVIKYLFTVPKNQKVTEKAMMRVLVSTICSILLCVTCLVSTTWAWYTVSLTSENNVIKTGTWSPEILADSQPSTQTTEETSQPVEDTTAATESTEVTEQATTEANEATTEVTESTTEATQSTTEATEEETTEANEA